MDDEKQERLFKFIPHEFDLEGITVNFSKRYSNQFTEKDLPAIALTYIESGAENFIYFNKLYSIINELKSNIESFVTEDGKLEYVLDDEKAYEIESVEKYVNDSWDLIDSNAYYLNDDYNLEFQTPDDVPDEGTDIRVNYNYYKIEVKLGGEFRDTVQVDVVTSNYEDDDTDVYINGLRLCKFVIRKVKEELRFGFEESDMVIRDVSETTDLSEIEGEDYHYRRSFDFDVAYHKTYTRTYDTIDEIRGDLLMGDQTTERFNLQFDIDFNDYEVEEEFVIEK